MLKLRILLKETNFAVLQNKEQPKNIQELHELFMKEIQSKKLSPLSIVYLLHQIGFMPDRGDLVQGTHIVLGESVGDTSLERQNTDKERTMDHGLWQINDRNIKDSKFYKILAATKAKQYDDTIKAYQANKRMTPEQKEERIKKVLENKKKALASLDSGWGVAFISLADTLDPFKSTLYAKFKMERMRKKKGEKGKWFGWVNNVSQLDAKYGVDKRKIAEQAVEQYMHIFQSDQVEQPIYMDKW